jgi:hypothetical protein
MYDGIIKDCKNKYEVSKFLKYMLITVKKELEKEYMMHHLKEVSSRKWETLDYQTLQYFLSMKGNLTVLDFASMYNRFNDKKRAKELFETMLLPLIEEGTLEIDRETKKYMFDNEPNLVLSLNRKRISDIDRTHITRIGI